MRIEEIVGDQGARTTGGRPDGREAADLDSCPSDYSVVIVDNVVLTNAGRKARLEELAAW